MADLGVDDGSGGATRFHGNVGVNRYDFGREEIE